MAGRSAGITTYLMLSVIRCMCTIKYGSACRASLRDSTARCTVVGVDPWPSGRFRPARCVIEMIRFAYGQTGSGKTFTLFGPENDPNLFSPSPTVPDSAGIVPRAIRCSTVFCSFSTLFQQNRGRAGVFGLLQGRVRVAQLETRQ
jgi:hypothetical protein